MLHIRNNTNLLHNIGYNFIQVHTTGYLFFKLVFWYLENHFPNIIASMFPSTVMNPSVNRLYLAFILCIYASVVALTGQIESCKG